MRAVFRFLLNMDRGAGAALALSCALFLGVAALFAAGRLGLVPDVIDAGLAHLRGLAMGPWGPAALIVLFCAGAFLGAPQFALIGAAIALFGPVRGALYAWLATMIAALATYGLGVWGGLGLMARLRSAGVVRASRILARNGFAASFLIRNVPSAPFIVVNMALGAGGCRFWPYVLGSGAGFVPKIALIALTAGSLSQAARGALVLAFAFAIGAAIVWLAIVSWTRRQWAARTREAGEADQPGQAPPR